MAENSKIAKGALENPKWREIENCQKGTRKSKMARNSKIAKRALKVARVRKQKWWSNSRWRRITLYAVTYL